MRGVAMLPMFALSADAGREVLEQVAMLEKYAGLLQQTLPDVCLFFPEHVARTVVAVIVAIRRQSALVQYARADSHTPLFILNGRALASMVAFLERVTARFFSDSSWAQSHEGKRLHQAAREILRETRQSRDAFAVEVCTRFGDGGLAVLPGSSAGIGEAEEGEISQDEELWTPLGEFLQGLDDLSARRALSSVDQDWSWSDPYLASSSSATLPVWSPLSGIPLGQLRDSALPPSTTNTTTTWAYPRSPASTSPVTQQNTPPPEESSSSSPSSSSSSSRSNSERLLPPAMSYPTPANSSAALPTVPSSSSSSSSPQASLRSEAAMAPPAFPRTPKRRRSAERVKTPSAPRKKPRYHDRCYCPTHVPVSENVQPSLGRAVPIPESLQPMTSSGLDPDSPTKPTSSRQSSMQSSLSSHESFIPAYAQDDRRYSASSSSSWSSSSWPSSSSSSSFPSSSSSLTLVTFPDTAEDQSPHTAAAEVDVSRALGTGGADAEWLEFVVYDPENAPSTPLVEDEPERSIERQLGPPPPSTMSKAAGKRRCLDGIVGSIRAFLQR
ncbi:hypothetical protein OH77DRAFT_1429739 [Trametes cingulata]|nr:hypothetical protein OH77DRAFT_1429739 [Trametes cingulata]